MSSILCYYYNSSNPSDTKKSPFVATATSVGMQNLSVSLFDLAGSKAFPKVMEG